MAEPLEIPNPKLSATADSSEGEQAPMGGEGVSRALRDEYYAISLWQPWATWIAWGWKTIETRRHTRFKRLAGNRIAIHAANHWDPDWLQQAARFLTQDQFLKTKSYRHPMGALVCSVHVIEHMPLTEHHSKSALIDCTYTGFATRYGLVLRPDIEIFDPPIPMRGRQGIWCAKLTSEPRPPISGAQAT